MMLVPSERWVILRCERNFTIGEELLAKTQLNIAALSERHIGVTKSIGDGYSEAARVCLDRRHGSPQDFTVVDNTAIQEVEVAWEVTDQQTRNAWADGNVTTEAGAYCLAMANAELTRGLYAVRRAQRGSGVDYYLGPLGCTPEDLETSMRLEVSGTDEGTVGMLQSRLKQKMEQAGRVDSNLPALATVIGFAVKKVLSADVEPK